MAYEKAYTTRIKRILLKILQDISDLIYLFYITLFLIIGLIVYFIISAIRGVIKKGVKEKDWYLQFFLSKEHTVSQFFFLFSVFFLGVTLLAFNKDLGEPLSWHTILLLVSAIGLVIAYYFKVIYTLTVSLVGLTVLGLIPITGALFFLSTKSGLSTLEDMTKGAFFFSSWEIIFSLFVFLIFLVGGSVYTLSRKLVFKSKVAAILFLVVLFGIIALLPEQTTFLKTNGYYGFYKSSELSITGILWGIFFNILIFLELVGIIFWAI